MSVYFSTGDGGCFFNELYDNAYSLETIRKVPSSVGELKEAGLSDIDVADYFSLIKRLYGEVFLARNMLLPPKGATDESKAVWEQLYNFCLSHSLVPEFADEKGEHWQAEFPSVIEFYGFIHQLEKCPYIIHLDSFDDFRLAVEMELADLPQDWYLSLRYNVRISHSLDMDRPCGSLVRYDRYANKMVLLSELESKYLLEKIQQDLTSSERHIAQHDRSALGQGKLVPKQRRLDGQIGMMHASSGLQRTLSFTTRMRN